MGFETYLPWGTLVIAIFTFGIWMYVKQLEVVHKPPGPNIGLVVLVLGFLLALGFVAPLVVGFDPANATNTTISTALSWVGIGGGILTLMAGGIRLITGGKK